MQSCHQQYHKESPNDGTTHYESLRFKTKISSPVSGVEIAVPLNYLSKF